MRHYCTLFDSKYLPQGLALYESLKRHSSEPFQLYILGMDDEVHQSIPELAAFVTPLSYFEKCTGIDEVRKTRTFQEYCWTCASVFTHRLASLGGFPEITYLDADTFFFSDPEVIFEEIGEKAVGIVPHRFPQHRKHMEINGRFNVSLCYFKEGIGFQCLEKWARQCREKCSASDGCGDQKYLDTWPSDYQGEVCAIQNLGVGLAPWNIGQYEIVGDREAVYVNGEKLVFYHAHEYSHGKRLTNYKLRDEDRALIYAPYIEAVEAAKLKIQSVEVSTTAN